VSVLSENELIVSLGVHHTLSVVIHLFTF